MPPDPPSSLRWYRPDQVAALLSISRATVYRRIEDGTIPAVKIGGIYRIPISALQPLLIVADPTASTSGDSYVSHG